MPEEVKVPETKTGDEVKAPIVTPARTERTPEQIAEYNLKNAVEKARAAGVDPSKVIGVNLKIDETLSDEEPLTVGKLREFHKQEGKKTAINLADDIEDEAERDGVKELLENSIRPSGDPQKDLTIARGAFGSERTRQVAEEAARKSNVQRTATGGSAPANQADRFEPTAEEMVFMKPPYNLTKEKIIAARPKA